MMANNTTNEYICSGSQGWNVAMNWVSFGLGILALIVISFTYQRTRLWQGCCRRLPGIAQPINLLSHAADHTINVILFAALAGDILLALFSNETNKGLGPNANPYVASVYHTVVVPIVIVLEVCIRYFPLFGGVDCPVPIVGHMIALLYLPFILTLIIVRDTAFTCGLGVVSIRGSSVLTGLYITARVPVYCAFLVVLIWFLQASIKDCIMWHKFGFNSAMEKLQGVHRSLKYYKGCVQHLLRSDEDYRRNKSRLFYCLCPCLTSPRRLPLRFTGAMTIATIILYQVCLLLSGTLFYLFSLLEQYMTGNREAIIRSLNTLSPSNGERSYTVLLEIVQSLLVVLPVSPVVSLLFCFVLMSHLTISVYKNLLSASRGELNLSKGFSSFQLAASLRYAGYQIAFALTAFATYTLVLWVLGLIAALLFFGFKYFTDAALLALSYFLIPVGWIAIVVGIQMAVSKFIFLKRGGGKFIIISNKRLFQWFTYVLFVYNAIVGLVLALLRVVISATLGLLLMLRLDRVILMKGFELFDLGHNAYMGFLHVEHAYNNPVVQVFVRLMAEQVVSEPVANGNDPSRLAFTSDQDFAYDVQEHSLLSRELKPQQYGVVTPQDSGSKVGSRRVKNRWLVAYTLLRNPSIQQLTASRLKGGEEEDPQWQ